ncbi:adenylate kinase [Streptomyces sp. NPDC020983]|uniref:adenylate kinase n=1 Tax=Streptomyces sp. NPDC020983 TaxID=3365106 RepID=UPI0037B42D33
MTGRGPANMLVVGMCGAGKTTLARTLSQRLGLRLVDVDGLRHGPGWSVRAQFAADVDRLTHDAGWVADSGAYAEVRDLLWQRASYVVWLDLPRWTLVRRVAGRSLRRVLTRQELWNGNRESLRGMFRRTHPLAKALFGVEQRRAETARRLAGFDGCAVRLLSASDVRTWTSGCAPVQTWRTTPS